MCTDTSPETHRLQLYIQFSSLALIYYDYALTFADEKELIWQSRLSHVTILYVWCRYAMVANFVFLFGYLGTGGISCDRGYLISGILSILGLCGILGIWGLRMQALCNNKKVLVWFASLGIIALVSNAFQVAGNRCQGNDLFLQSGRITLIARSCFDFSCFILTAARCHLSQNVRSRGKRLESVVLEQAVSGFTITSTVLSFQFSGCFLRRLLNALSLP
jgi:hypothetical protein